LLNKERDCAAHPCAASLRPANAGLRGQRCALSKFAPGEFVEAEDSNLPLFQPDMKKAQSFVIPESAQRLSGILS
ncbi:MAG: hypothetical protein PVI70_05800, partial [Gammaproteobacteria bacterium]